MPGARVFASHGHGERAVETQRIEPLELHARVLGAHALQHHGRIGDAAALQHVGECGAGVLRIQVDVFGEQRLVREQHSAEIQLAVDRLVQPVLDMLRNDSPRITCSVKFLEPTVMRGPARAAGQQEVAAQAAEKRFSIQPSPPSDASASKAAGTAPARICVVSTEAMPRKIKTPKAAAADCRCDSGGADGRDSRDTNPRQDGARGQRQLHLPSATAGPSFPSRWRIRAPPGRRPGCRPVCCAEWAAARREPAPRLRFACRCRR